MVDILEANQAVDEYNDAVAQLRLIGARLERLERQLDMLWPLLEHPGLVRQLLTGLHEQADILAENGQLALEASDQL